MVYKKKKIINRISEKGYRNNPLTEEQKANNKHKSRTRARVEHLFGFVENSMNGSFIRTIGMARANFRYNFTQQVAGEVALAG